MRMWYKRRFHHLIWSSILFILGLACMAEPLASGRRPPTPSPSQSLERRSTPTALPIPTASPIPTNIPTPTPTTPMLHVAWSPKEAQQGQSVLLLLRSDRPMQFEAIFDGLHLAPIAFAPDAAWALVPIAPWQKSGPRPLLIQASNEEGAFVEDVLRLTVIEQAFPIQYLDIPADRAMLLDPQLIAEERAMLSEIYQAVTPRRLWEPPFIWPLGNTEGIITTEFGTRRSYGDGPPTSYHAALDIAAPPDTPVYAAARGRVAFSDDVHVRGKVIIIDHGAGLYSAYFHMNDRFVAQGEFVERGTLIGSVGNTGLSTGAHLHWEIRLRDVPVDPTQWLQTTWYLPNE